MPIKINLYWHLHQTRNLSTKRRYYRYIKVEKKRLMVETGVDSEELRLYCRTLTRGLNRHAENRLANYRKSMTKTLEFCGNYLCVDCV